MWTNFFQRTFFEWKWGSYYPSSSEDPSSFLRKAGLFPGHITVKCVALLSINNAKQFHPKHLLGAPMANYCRSVPIKSLVKRIISVEDFLKCNSIHKDEPLKPTQGLSLMNSETHTQTAQSSPHRQSCNESRFHLGTVPWACPEGLCNKHSHKTR